MSMDVFDTSMSPRTPAFQRARVEAALAGHVTGPVKDVVVMFGGWGGAHAGDLLPAGPGSGASRLEKSVAGLHTGRVLIVRAWEGSLDFDGQAGDDALAMITRNFHPLGKVIVYGYSAGGFSALRLVHRLGTDCPYYNVDTQRLERYPPKFGGTGAHVVAGWARIDKLITVDPASGPTSSWVSRRVGPSVRVNLNIYQTHPASHPQLGGLVNVGVLSHGEPTEADDPTATRIVNVDWTARYDSRPGDAHGLIGTDTHDPVLAQIRNELGVTS